MEKFKKIIVLVLLMLIPLIAKAKVAESGLIVRDFPVEHNDERLEAAIILDDGSFVVTGWFSAYDDGRTDFGTFDDYIGIVMKYDKQGKLLWETVIENSYTLWDIVEEKDGTIIVVGDGVVARLDKEGNIIKAKTDFDLLFTDVGLDEQGNIYALSHNKILKLSKDYEVLSEKNYPRSTYVEDIIVDNDGIIVCSRNIGTEKHSIVEKYNHSFETIWSTELDVESMESIAVIDDKIIVNSSKSISLLTNQGELLWTKSYTSGTYIYIRSVGPSQNNTILAFGEEEFQGDNLVQIFLLEYSLNGELIDKKTYLPVPLKVVKPNCSYGGNDCACGGIIDSRKGFVLTGFTIQRNTDYNAEEDDNFKGQIYGYIIYDTYGKRFNIKTKTDGNGTIEVVNSAEGGDMISFKITAKKNLKLTGLTIVSDSGERIEFHEEEIKTDKSGVLSISTNKFTMPFDNVTIEATWSSSIINPNTGTGISIIIISIVLLLTSITYLILKRNRIHVG